MVFGASWLFHSGLANATRPHLDTRTIVVKAGETFDGIQFPVGTQVNLTVAGNVVTSVELSRDFTMNGHLIRRDTRLTTRNGKLECFWSRPGQTLGAIVFKPDAQVCFTRQGALEMVHLSRVNAINGLAYAAHTWVQFHPGGTVAQGELAYDVRRKGLRLPRASTITFYLSGAIKSVAIKPGARFGKLVLAPQPGYDAHATFWPNGRLQEAVLARSARIGSTRCAPGPISLEASGKLKQCEIERTPRQLATDAANARLAKMAQGGAPNAPITAPGTVSLIAGSLAVGDVQAEQGRQIAQPVVSKDGSAAVARFDKPYGLVADREGNLFLTESGSNRVVRKISTSGVVTTVAGVGGPQGRGYQDGAAASARFANPAAIAIDSRGNLYVADQDNHAIRKISSAGVVSTLVRSRKGPENGVQDCHAGSLLLPTGVAIDKAGNLLVSTVFGASVCRIGSAGALTTHAGTADGGYSQDGSLKEARFTSIHGMALDRQGNLFVGDGTLLRKISRAGAVSTLGNYAEVLADGTRLPVALLVDPAGNLYFSLNSTIRRLAPDGGLSIIAGVAGQRGNRLGVGGALDDPRDLVMLGPKTFAFISGNAVLKLVLP